MHFPRLPVRYKKMLEARSVESIEQLLRSINVFMIVLPFLFALAMLGLGLARHTVEDVRREKVALKASEGRAGAEQREKMLRGDLARAQEAAAAAETKVAAMEEGQRPRRLTKDQRDRLGAALRPFAGQVAVIAIPAGNSEIARFSEDFVEVFRAAGIRVPKRYNQLDASPFEAGIFLRVPEPDRMEPFPRAFAETLQRIGLKYASEKGEPPEGAAILLRIALKE